MLKVLSAAEMYNVDKLTTSEYGIPSLLLMENAATSVVRAIEENLDTLENKKILILCGKGNNGGDGATCARLLWMKGASVKAFLFGKIEETKGDARVNFEILAKLSGLKNDDFGNTIEFHDSAVLSKIFFDEPDVIVDALFGTGLSRPVEGDLKNLVSFLLESKTSGTLKNKLIVSVDLPSGLDADKHYPIGDCVKADLTVTFTAPKLANVFPPACNYGGRLYVANIGSPSQLIQSAQSQIFLTEKRDVKKWLEKTQVRPNSYKKSRGRCLIVAGSDDFPGAAALAANSCFMAGAGMVWLAVPKSTKETIASKVRDEVIIRTLEEVSGFKPAVTWEELDCVAIGCGLKNDEKTKNLLIELVENRKTPVVLDAEALNLLSPFEIQGNETLPLILTPHIGEFRRLVGKNLQENERIEAAANFAEKHKVILVLKGQRNLIARPDGVVAINPTGNAGISRAGAGDTLTGIIASFVAQTCAVVESPSLEDMFEAVASALYVAGLAAEIAAQKFSDRLMTPYQAVKCLKQAIDQILAS
ncbi:MAG: NAD(P)H-hydrate dehydratase [Acidobacteria bacterium]|jgi:NAD(P)H-hydrate epimerase|nr:MAG: NAD(P)H-hydrate dehydratase [Acidobacteriota bacterium]GIU81207.1 MAG: bifunctional NAD(P)H-hydrate repair enzyme Nnr [Pyrinomonadaceae bacterium]